MENRIYDEKNGLWYEKQGNYYLPCISLPEEENEPIGIWGQRHLRYLKQHRKVLYTNLLTSGKLNSHLAELNKQAEDMFFRVVKQLAEKEGVTEKLKAENQMEWVGRIHKEIAAHLGTTEDNVKKLANVATQKISLEGKTDISQIMIPKHTHRR